MILIKYGHSCFEIKNKDGHRIIIDPGTLSDLPQDLQNVTAVIVTHDHADHYSPSNVLAIKKQSANAQLFTPADLMSQIPDAISPSDGQTVSTENFKLTFYHTAHEHVREGVRLPDNISLTINDLIAHTGDSYSALPPTEYLLTPIAAPWTNINQTAKFVSDSKSKIVIPMHDGILSEAGQGIYDNHLSSVADSTDKEYRRIDNNDPMQLL